MKKVVKFGGSSLASAEQFRKVGNIIRSDKERRFVVPSAPGKRFSKDIKVTDMCNAKCSVCSNHGNEKCSKIDYEKLKYVIQYLDKKGLIKIKSVKITKKLESKWKKFDFEEWINEEGVSGRKHSWTQAVKKSGE